VDGLGELQDLVGELQQLLVLLLLLLDGLPLVVGQDLLFDERPHGAEVQRRSFELRKSLVVLRRLVLPMREPLLPRRL
jgi:hypothetical protein